MWCGNEHRLAHLGSTSSAAVRACVRACETQPFQWQSAAAQSAPNEELGGPPPVVLETSAGSPDRMGSMIHSHAGGWIAHGIGSGSTKVMHDLAVGRFRWHHHSHPLPKSHILSQQKHPSD